MQMLARGHVGIVDARTSQGVDAAQAAELRQAIGAFHDAYEGESDGSKS